MMSPGQVYLLPSAPQFQAGNNNNCLVNSSNSVGVGILKRSSNKVAHNRKQSQVKTRNDPACISVAVGKQLYSLQNLNS